MKPNCAAEPIPSTDPKLLYFPATSFEIPVAISSLIIEVPETEAK